MQSEETRHHLRDAHRRVMSVAAVQTHLHVAATIDSIEMAPYLSTLCESLTGSIIGDGRAVSLEVHAKESLVTSDHAVCIGLIVTELVINALKHAFPVTVKDVGSTSHMRRRAPIGSFRSRTTGLAGPKRTPNGQGGKKRGLAPALSALWRNSSMPKWKLRVARPAQPCQ